MSQNHDLELWLNIATDGNAELCYKLFKRFDDIKNIYNADAKDYYKIKDIDDASVERLCDKSLNCVEECKSFCKKFNVRIIYKDDEKFPERLMMIYNPPRLLYVMGKDIDIDDNVCIAVVGTRSCTDYGISSARKISYEMTKQGAVIVSGIAQGIDAVAHSACLEANGQTIAVLGSGIATAYPACNRELYKKVIASGMLITEYPPNSPPDKSHFPVRNRLISGISLGTVIIEASTRSGALITARHTILQGKFLYAIPAKINDYSGSGNIKLIKNGAKVINCGADVIEDFELIYPHRVQAKYKINIPLPIDTIHEEPKTKPAKQIQNKPVVKEKIDVEKFSWFKTLSPSAKQVAKYLSEKNLTTDELVQKGIDLDVLLTDLTVMEIEGIIEAIPGGMYTLKI